MPGMGKSLERSSREVVVARNSLLKSIPVLLAFASGAVATMAHSGPLPPVTAQDALSWKTVYPAMLTPDGQWFVSFLRPYWSYGGDAAVVLRCLSDGTERRYPAGD